MRWATGLTLPEGKGKTRRDKLCGKRNGCNVGVGGMNSVGKDRGIEGTGVTASNYIVKDV